MELRKRACSVNATIEPLGAELLEVTINFGEDKFEFTPSSFAGGQFGDFICALYTLYHEKSNERYDGHSEWTMCKYHTDSNHKIQATTVAVEWDGEGPHMILEMSKRIDSNIINLRTTTDYGKTYKEYSANDRDFCYAISKACTTALKEFGFYGFRYSTEGKPIMLHQLLFLKAYALGNMEARELFVVDEEFDCCKTNFEKEMELLLFDM